MFLNVGRYQADDSYRREIDELLKLGNAHVRDQQKPCKGTNINICVAEGCYKEACLREEA